MECALRLVVRLAVSVCAVVGGSVVGPSDGQAGEQGMALRILPEVRLRKLHLVRPDLILYPIAVEVLC
jgi:hypothetical protein